MTNRVPLVRVAGKIEELPSGDYVLGAPSGPTGAAGATGPGGTGSGANFICNGRLTLTSGVPVTTTDVTGATVLYWTPYTGNQCSTYDSSVWTGHTFTELSYSLGTLAAAFQAWDVFNYWNGTSLALEIDEWANAAVTITIASPGVITWTGGPIVNGDWIVLTTTGTLPTGLSANTLYYAVGVSGSTFQLALTIGGTAINTSGAQSGTHTAHTASHRGAALGTQDGVYVKASDHSRRFLGSFVSTSTTTTEDSAGGVSSQVGGRRFCVNYPNAVRRHVAVIDTTASWSYATTSVRQANGATGNMVRLFCCVPEQFVEANLVVLGATSGGVSTAGIGVDSLSAMSGLVAGYYGASSSAAFSGGASYKGFPGAGAHSLSWLEKGAVGAVFYGTDGAVAVQSGLQVVTFA